MAMGGLWLMTKTIVTSIDVAKRAQVSQSAVSRTFTPGASVSAKTRQKVLEAAEELGYRPNAIARAMISGRTRLIAVLVAYLDNHFYPTVLEKLTRTLQGHGYYALLFMTDPGRQDRIVQKILEFQVEGIVMTSATLSSSLAKECADAGVPVVMINRYMPSMSASRVVSDNIEGGRLVAEHLLRGKHKRIAFVAGSEDSSSSRDREAGLLKGLCENGATLFDRKVGGYCFDGAANAARELFANPKKAPDAIFCANDQMAFAVMDVVRSELNLRIPQDVSVVGYGDVREAAWKGYDLTTVSQPVDALIDSTVHILLEQIRERTVRRRAAIIPAQLVVRGTTRPVK
jgi:DNA-binding LacI/PurR family transcriptional regulator